MNEYGLTVKETKATKATLKTTKATKATKFKFANRAHFATATALWV